VRVRGDHVTLSLVPGLSVEDMDAEVNA